MFAILGEIEFELLGGLTGMDYRSTADWAEHSLIQGKPLLEWIGEGLDEYSLAITLHASLGDPDKRLRELREAKAAHQPLAFVLGGGDYLGAFVLTELSNNVRRTTAMGRLHSATLAVTLREYTGKFTRKVSRPALIDGSFANTGLMPNLLTRVTQVPSTLQKLLGCARTVSNTLTPLSNLYSTIKSGNPAMLLGQVPGLLGMTKSAFGPIAGLQQVAGLIQGGADLVQLGDDLLGSANSALASLTSVDMSSVSGALSSLGSNFGGMTDALASLSGVGRGLVTSTLAGLGSSTLADVTGALSSLQTSGVDWVVEEFKSLPSLDLGSVTNALAGVQAVDLENVVTRVSEGATAVNQALVTLDASSKRLTGIAADIITRRA